MVIIFAILIFGFLIFVHELGHFVTAKKFGVKIHEFALGMGPAIFKKQKGEILYSVRALPIGGYVKMEGEDGESDDERSFGKLPAIKKIIVLFAGAFMNFISGFLIFVIIYSFAGGVAVPEIDRVIEGSPAQIAGIKEGDRITSVNGDAVHIQSDVTFSLFLSGDKDVDVEVLRGDEKLTFHIKPQLENDRYIIGFYPKYEEITPGNVLYNAFYNTFFVVRVVFESLKMMLTGQVGLGEMSGPVGIVGEIGKAARDGILQVLNFAALIAVNLGVMNLLPFPALDGGRIIFAAIEGIRRKPINPKVEGYVHAAGLILLFALMILITFSDIGKIVSGG